MAKAKTLTHVLCTNIITHSGSYGKTLRSIVFTDPAVSNPELYNYIWITSVGTEFAEGKYYDISAEYEATRRVLKRVKLLKTYEKSEQPDSDAVGRPTTPVDVFDLIYNIDDTHLTSN